MDPLSLLCRLAASVPPPRLHTVRYSGVLAPASKLRSRIVPKPASPPANDAETETPKRGGSRYRPWAELLRARRAVVPKLRRTHASRGARDRPEPEWTESSLLDPPIGRAACFGGRPAATSALRCAPWSFTDSVQQAGLRPLRVVA
jgi:hypothetical protein